MEISTSVFILLIFNFYFWLFCKTLIFFLSISSFNPNLCFFYLIFILLIVFYLPFVKLPFIFKFTHQCFLFFISISILILLIVFFLFVKLPFLLNFTLIKFILYFNFDPYSFNCYFLFLILLYN